MISFAVELDTDELNVLIEVTKGISAILDARVPANVSRSLTVEIDDDRSYLKKEEPQPDEKGYVILKDDPDGVGH